MDLLRLSANEQLANTKQTKNDAVIAFILAQMFEEQQIISALTSNNELRLF